MSYHVTKLLGGVSGFEKTDLSKLKLMLMQSSLEAFMEWKCFDIDTVKLKCSKFVPNIYISLNGIDNYFGTIREQNYSCEKVFPKWEMLLNGSDQICLMSAALEGDSSNVFFYDIYSIKTNTGVWESKYFYEQK
jgi:hypothetical protein